MFSVSTFSRRAASAPTSGAAFSTAPTTATSHYLDFNAGDHGCGAAGSALPLLAGGNTLCRREKTNEGRQIAASPLVPASPSRRDQQQQQDTLRAYERTLERLNARINTALDHARSGSRDTPPAGRARQQARSVNAVLWAAGSESRYKMAQELEMARVVHMLTSTELEDAVEWARKNPVVKRATREYWFAAFASAVSITIEAVKWKTREEEEEEEKAGEETEEGEGDARRRDYQGLRTIFWSTA
ncbi:hypothetical protein ACJZ2D_005084 [Fusarium nematophilum]